MGYKATLDKTTDEIIVWDGDEIIQKEPLTSELFQNLTDDNVCHSELHVYRYLKLMDREEDDEIDGHSPNEISFDVVMDEYKIVSLEDMEKSFRENQQRWLKSDEHDKLVKCLKKVKAQVPITNVMGLATGSLHPSGVNEERMGKAPAFQIAALLTISEVLGGGNPLPVTVQDPGYSRFDTEFLTTRLNFKVVDDPEIFPLINSESIVLNIGSWYMIPYWISQGEWPMSMITDLPERGSDSLFPPACKWKYSPMAKEYVSLDIGGPAHVYRIDPDDEDMMWLSPPQGDDEAAWCDDTHLWVKSPDSTGMAVAE
ncbi:uncharacterized protein BP5553_08226 [Venustampulla echinocandica]|uniref:SRR1-like domain-containing protein n=1 Tax=Venustampulla echinocandica TaxID=2656787 RepID=A0A370TG30_9HELO|nr:uncharacterized protein BP5553_08226 [Venustampulla echinocandica]RDL33858.1 hypothetical protein BP5553_08226 [Venustampulla echinocandica]